MKTLLRLIVIAGMFSAATAHAQSVAGTWQGTINPGKELRIVIVVAAATGGGLTAMMHSIDQGGQGIAASAVTLQGTTFSMAVSAMEPRTRGS